jgi:hypothetical protein
MGGNEGKHPGHDTIKPRSTCFDFLGHSSWCSSLNLAPTSRHSMMKDDRGLYGRYIYQCRIWRGGLDVDIRTVDGWIIFNLRGKC